LQSDLESANAQKLEFSNEVENIKRELSNKDTEMQFLKNRLVILQLESNDKEREFKTELEKKNDELRKKEEEIKKLREELRLLLDQKIVLGVEKLEFFDDNAESELQCEAIYEVPPKKN